MLGILKEEPERLVMRVLLSKGTSRAAKTGGRKEHRTSRGLRLSLPPSALRGPPWLCALSHSYLSVFQVSGVRCLPSPQDNRVFRVSAQLYFIWIWLRHVSILDNQYSSFFLSDSRNLYLSRSSIYLFNNFEKWTEIIYNLGFFLLDLTLTFCK